MSDFFDKIGRVPSNLNLDKLLDGVDGNKTKIRYLREGIVYFLNLLYVDNYTHYEKSGGFININEKILSSVIGKDRPAQIVRILKSNNVIEVMNHRQGHYSRSYRLTEQYTSDFNEVDFSDRIKEKLKVHQLKTEKQHSESTESNLSYSHIFNQFKKNRLEIDVPNLNFFLQNLGEQLIKKHQLLKEHQDLTYNSILNFIGKSIELSNDINKNKPRLSISNSNKRFHSNITSLPKIVRPFLTVNGKGIGEVDLNSSQPYILSTIVNDKFIDNDNNSFNLKNLYPELYNDIINTKTIVPSKKKGYSNYSLGIYFNDDEMTRFSRFADFDFTNDFYQHLLNKGWEINPEYMVSKRKFKEGRNYVKKHIMTFLFDKNPLHREGDNVIKLIKIVYPELNELVERFYDIYSQHDFSVLLQRAESCLILQNVCVKIKNYSDSIPFFTIHDSIITTVENLENVRNIVQETITEITGKTPGIKTKILIPSTEVSKELFDEVWDKVKIRSPKHYEKMRGYILQRNIDIGSEFLSL